MRHEFKKLLETWHTNIPLPLAKRMKAELVSDLGSVHGVRQILLVSEHEENGLTQLVLQQSCELTC